jgi:two-component system sensor histidine kinase NreB
MLLARFLPIIGPVAIAGILAKKKYVPESAGTLKTDTSTFGIIVKMESFGTEIRMSEQRNIALFRVCQEALANIAKYADTSEASLIFTWGDHDLKMIIEDHGKGFDYEQQGKQSSGLEAMKERMYLVGGTCQVSSAIGEGTMVRVSLPFK